MLILALANGWKTAIMIAAMIAVMYFFLIKPQSDQQKKDREYRDGLHKGDLAMTTGGIHGRVVSNDPGFIVLEIAEGVRIKVAKNIVVPIPGSVQK